MKKKDETTEVEKPVESKKDEKPSKSEYIFTGNVIHDGNSFEKGAVAKADANVMKQWLANGVIKKK